MYSNMIIMIIVVLCFIGIWAVFKLHSISVNDDSQGETQKDEDYKIYKEILFKCETGKCHLGYSPISGYIGFVDNFTNDYICALTFYCDDISEGYYLSFRYQDFKSYYTACLTRQQYNKLNAFLSAWNKEIETKKQNDSMELVFSKLGIKTEGTKQ